MYGIRKEGMRILFLVGQWLNGFSLPIRGEKKRISTHPEPRLKEIFRATKADYKTHETAHERMLDVGLLKEDYVCRRKIDWMPTELGLRALRDCFNSYSDQLKPSWAEGHHNGPLFGDPNEGLVHRKGVAIAAKMLPKQAWAHDIDRTPYGVEWYPKDERGKQSYDLHVVTNEWSDDIGVEVITESNNRDHLVDKWKRFQNKDEVTFWVFDNRETACKMWNELDKRDVFHLDGQFNNYANWSAKAINHKVWRSSQQCRGKRAYDIIQTVTGLLEGDDDTIYDLFDEHYNGDKYN